jgi:hypothetical protein
MPFLAILPTFVISGLSEPTPDHNAIASEPTTFTPTRFDDPSPGACLEDDCSLREAVLAAISLPGGDVIELAAGTYHLTIAEVAQDSAGGDLDITDQLTITGAAADSTIIDATGVDRVFEVPAGGHLTLEDLTVTGGSSPDIAGGFNVRGEASLTRTVVAGNTANAGGGFVVGGSDAVLYLTDSLVHDNQALNLGVTNAAGGGVLIQDGAHVHVSGTTFSNNSSAASAGAISLNTSNLDVVNSTFSGNDAFSGAAIAAVNSSVTVSFSTITANTSGTALHNFVCDTCEGGFTLDNSIVASNPNGDCNKVESLGYNIDSDGSCAFAVPANDGDITVQDPGLGPLADNGGFAPTHNLLPESPAIDAAGGPDCPETDQRGIERPNGDACDIGAVEALPSRQGDVDCDGDEDAVDALRILQSVAGLGDPDCIGTAGDVDCDEDSDAVDALQILRHVAGLPVNQDQGCPAIGDPL